LDDHINPQVKTHGGKISIVRYDENDAILYIEMSGGCQGCSSSEVTLRQGVENIIFENHPEIMDIKDVTAHEEGENPYYT